ncbi:hypothetical protein VNO78_16303 [Psophocarpus tetragonolobus]|uniref:Uncharacterized protein n=1 Tax=Psophocarpus tetragonolobus TaxID=3891 RepID=A0AAN9SGY0_PSOTE
MSQPDPYSSSSSTSSSSSPLIALLLPILLVLLLPLDLQPSPQGAHEVEFNVDIDDDEESAKDNDKFGRGCLEGEGGKKVEVKGVSFVWGVEGVELKETHGEDKVEEGGKGLGCVRVHDPCDRVRL